MCLVFEALGPSLQFLMGNYAAQGLPLPFVKKSLQQVRNELCLGGSTVGVLAGEHVIVFILGSSAMNFCMTASAGLEKDLISLPLFHLGGDPGNQLEDADLMSIEVKIADLGSACWTVSLLQVLVL